MHCSFSLRVLLSASLAQSTLRLWLCLQNNCKIPAYASILLSREHFSVDLYEIVLGPKSNFFSRNRLIFGLFLVLVEIKSHTGIEALNLERTNKSPQRVNSKYQWRTLFLKNSGFSDKNW